MTRPPEPIDRAAVTLALGRIAAALGRRWGTEAETQVREYARVLERAGATAASLQRAVDRWLALERRWPAPADLAREARAGSPSAAARELADDAGCPGCGTAYEWREWLVPRRAPHHPPATVEVAGRDGAVVPLVPVVRRLCECGLAATLRVAHHLALAVMGDRGDPHALAEIRRRATRR